MSMFQILIIVNALLVVIAIYVFGNGKITNRKIAAGLAGVVSLAIPFAGWVFLIYLSFKENSNKQTP